MRMPLVVAVLAAAASVVGTTSAGKAQFRVGLSFNCDNKTSAVCMPDRFGLGGFSG